ncbi:hypothetical protein CTRI78_v008786 [Colletotrichum trifolii]|uniref:Uncharacterized protein n=1 Tax=Colletotrichum trifolii TaxID=5466 RepID=A0A4R8R286_COLTR|nr:hypothetical protein CTRI78_v008786 [Colletotrichum trifolii]
MRDQKNKLLYPFRRDHLDRLNGRLDTANQMLRSALQLAELEISASSGQIIRAVETGMDSLSQEVSTMHLNMQTSMQQIQIGTSTSQSNLVNIKSKVDLSNLTLLKTEQDTAAVRRDVAEMKAIMEALLSSRDQALLPRLVSKPDVLRRIYDDTELSPKPQDAVPIDSFVESHQFSSSYASLQCQCKPRQSLKASKGRKGPAFWKLERITDRVHSPECHFAKFNTQSKSRWSVGLSINALRDIASIAITISMSTTFGAGGFAISPAFTYHPIRHNSPAMQVIGLLGDALGLRLRSKLARLWSDEDCNQLFRKGIKTLQTTLAAGKWSPLDIDRDGASLLTVAFQRSQYWRGEASWHITHLFPRCGVAAWPPSDAQRTIAFRHSVSQKSRRIFRHGLFDRRAGYFTHATNSRSILLYSSTKVVQGIYQRVSNTSKLVSDGLPSLGLASGPWLVP